MEKPFQATKCQQDQKCAQKQYLLIERQCQDNGLKCLAEVTIKTKWLNKIEEKGSEGQSDHFKKRTGQI